MRSLFTGWKACQHGLMYDHKNKLHNYEKIKECVLQRILLKLKL